MPTFSLTPAATQVTLKPVKTADPKSPPSFAGRATFTVTNTTALAATGTGTVDPQDPAPASMFSIADPAIVVPPNGTVQFAVDVTAPAGTPAGTYGFKAVVASTLKPDEDFATSSLITCLVPGSGGKPFPWWIPIAAAVVLIGAFVAFKLLSGGTPPPLVVPALMGSSLADAKVSLAQAGLESSVSFVPALPADAKGTPVIDQTPSAGTAAAKGDVVSLVVAQGPVTSQTSSFGDDLKQDLDPADSSGDVDVLLELSTANILTTRDSLRIGVASSTDPAACGPDQTDRHQLPLQTGATYCMITDNERISLISVKLFVPEEPRITLSFSTWDPPNTEA
jgi:hypothetical protein